MISTNGFLKLAAGGALLATLQFGVCQSGMHLRRSGQGILYAYGRDFHPNEVSVDLGAGGHFTISTNRTTFLGNWSGGGSRVDLEVTGIHGMHDETDRAQGTGHITFDRDGDWTHVLISGRNLTDRSKVTLDFTPYSDRRLAHPQRRTRPAVKRPWYKGGNG